MIDSSGRPIGGAVRCCNGCKLTTASIDTHPHPHNTPHAQAASPDAIIQEAIKKPVVVFSKSYCPYCRKAKEVRLVGWLVVMSVGAYQYVCAPLAPILACV